MMLYGQNLKIFGRIFDVVLFFSSNNDEFLETDIKTLSRAFSPLPYIEIVTFVSCEELTH